MLRRARIRFTWNIGIVILSYGRAMPVNLRVFRSFLFERAYIDVAVLGQLRDSGSLDGGKIPRVQLFIHRDVLCCPEAL